MHSLTTLRSLTLMLVVVLSQIVWAAEESTAADAQPWQTLFDGSSLDDWVIVNRSEGVSLQDDAMVLAMVPQTKRHSFVSTQASYDDFILELEYKNIGLFNSGILFRCEEPGADAQVDLYGFQVKLDPSPKRKWTGGIFDDFGKSWKWYYDLSADERARNAFVRDEWNHFRIEAIGTTIKVWVNRIPVTHLVHDKYTSGPIALKMHSFGNHPEKSQYRGLFRHIRIISDKPSTYATEMDLPPRSAPAE